jgi:hypothetical protein
LAHLQDGKIVPTGDTGEPQPAKAKTDAVTRTRTDKMPEANMDWDAKRARAREAASKLDEATDALNELIDEAEKAIAELRLGVPGRVTFEAIEDDQTGLTYCRDLLFWKEDKVWRLMVASGTEGDPEDDCIPLRNASRDVRLRAVDHLARLVDNMIETAETEVTEVESAKQVALKFIQNLSADKKAK